MEEITEFDEIGPEKVYQVYDPKLKLHGVLVIDNQARGPSKGGIRMTPTVTTSEVFKLARTMTWKTAMADLPFGGGKAGIRADVKNLTLKQKHTLIARFAEMLRPVCPSQFIAAPDINTGEREMRVFAKANGSMKSCTGKPAKMGGIPHELGSTGLGVAHATKIAAKYAGLDLEDATVAIEGFGNVGIFSYKFLEDWGAKVVATSDSRGTIYNPRGIPYKQLMDTKKKDGTVTAWKNGKVLSSHDLISLPVDILITAAIPDVIKLGEEKSVKAKLIVEGSNIPMAYKVEDNLAKRGVLVVPDFVANAGGVISSYVEYIGGTPEKMFKLVEQKVSHNTKLVLETAKKKHLRPREAAIKICRERVLGK